MEDIPKETLSGDSQWRRKVFSSPGLTQPPPGRHLAKLAQRWNGRPGSLDPEHIDLTGTWLADGYECYRARGGPKRIRLPTKRVTVSQVGRDFTALKIDRDPCVPAGLVAFHGRMSSDSRSATVTFTVGNLARPASGTIRGTFKIIDRDHFQTGVCSTGEKIFFVRARHTEAGSGRENA